MNLVWFRNDIRLADNPALNHAINADINCIALYIIHEQQHLIHGESPAKLDFIKAHVKDLRKRLNKIGVPLMVVHAATFSDVPRVFEKIINEHSIEGVYCHHSYWPNEMSRDEKVFTVLNSQNIKINSYHTNNLLPPGTVIKDNGEMYHVFTPYKNKYIECLKTDYRLPLSVPTVRSKSGDFEAETGSIKHHFSGEHLNQSMIDLWPIGEVAANDRLKSFAAANDYQQERDFPAIAGTSSLSPYLAIGVISAKQCLAHMLKVNGEKAFHSTWVSELIWRDFYNDLMYHYPRLAKHKTFKAGAVDYWHTNPELFEKWQQGQTGFPIVDAGMRQLLQEGWMHNRVRMVVASFLSKLCLIDWRLGEAHFMAHLLDGDLASNNGGWQWSSATGCDAAPYFRIFNPTTQSKKFDPDGTYIRQYVPELTELSTKEIHDPKPESRNDCGYVQPVIDYKVARQEALSWFKDNPVN